MNEKQFEQILRTAAVKLGMTPEELKKTAEKGDVNNIMSHLDKKSADKVKDAFSKTNTDEIYNSFKGKSKK